ncbi:MAG TPA: alpha/beta hydrolase [Microbacteriaceae bacterium]|nr:alpha/beta hydrolase [Microbacteriaceae bacterium]
MRWGEFVDADGVTIRYRVWSAVAEPRGVIALLHGVGEHSGRYDETARAFTAAGWEVWADDHRGHGETGRLQHGGDVSRMGRLGPGGLRSTVAAIEQFLAIARAARPDLPFVVLGHSWGSLVTQMMMNRGTCPADAVILTGTAYRTPFAMDGGNLNRKHAHLGTTGVEWLSRDPEVARAFVADELCTATPLRTLFGLPDTLRLLGRPAPGIAVVPLLIAVGSDDTLGGERSARALAQAYVTRSHFTDVTVLVYPGARHEILNETNRLEVQGDLVEWLDQRFASAARDSFAI